MECQIIEVYCDRCGKKLGTKKVPVNDGGTILGKKRDVKITPFFKTLCNKCQKVLDKEKIRKI